MPRKKESNQRVRGIVDAPCIQCFKSKELMIRLMYDKIRWFLLTIRWAGVTNRPSHCSLESRIAPLRRRIGIESMRETPNLHKVILLSDLSLPYHLASKSSEILHLAMCEPVQVLKRCQLASNLLFENSSH